VTEPKKPSHAVTPIKKSMVHQQEEGAHTFSITEERFKAYDTILNGRQTLVHYDEDTGDVIIDGKLYHTQVEEFDGFFIANVEDKHNYKIEMQDGQIYLEGRIIDFSYNHAIPKLERKRSTKSGQSIIKAPLPGNVIEIAVEIGDLVDVGTKLLTLEAMKMQNDILSDGKGRINEISVSEGELVSSDQRLLVIVEEES
jgi:biotin carboxyl carrier protein